MAPRSVAERKQVEGDLVSCGRAFDVSLYLAAVFLLLGIISDAANIPLGLESISWLLLASAALLAAVSFRLGWAVSWYLKTTR